MSYAFDNLQGRLMSSDSEIYRNESFSSTLDGKTDQFDAISGVPNGSVLTVELNVITIS